MRKYLVIAFLGAWVALVPFLPIRPGSTQKLLLGTLGGLIVVLALWSLRETTEQ
jgi:hypothetical protein